MIIAILCELLLVTESMVLIAVGYCLSDNDMTAAGVICTVIAAVALVGLMCTRSFWRVFFNVED